MANLTSRVVQTGGIACADVAVAATIGAGADTMQWESVANVQSRTGTWVGALPASGAIYETAGDPDAPTFTMPLRLDSGMQYLWVRMYAFNAGDDSFHAKLGSAAWRTYNAYPSPGSITWVLVGADAVSGDVDLVIQAREDACYIDAVLVTTDSLYDPNSINGGLGPAASQRAIDIDGSGVPVTSGSFYDDLIVDDFSAPLAAPWQVVDWGGLQSAGVSGGRLLVDADGNLWDAANTSAAVMRPVPSGSGWRIAVRVDWGDAEYARTLIVAAATSSVAQFAGILRNSEDSARATYLWRDTVQGAADWTGGEPSQPHADGWVEIAYTGSALEFYANEQLIGSRSISWTPTHLGLPSIYLLTGGAPAVTSYDDFAVIPAGEDPAALYAGPPPTIYTPSFTSSGLAQVYLQEDPGNGSITYNWLLQEKSGETWLSVEQRDNTTDSIQYFSLTAGKQYRVWVIPENLAGIGTPKVSQTITSNNSSPVVSLSRTNGTLDLNSDGSLRTVGIFYDDLVDSAVAAYMTPGAPDSTDDLAGNNDGSWNGNSSYADGIFGRAWRLEGNNGVDLNSIIALTSPSTLLFRAKIPSGQAQEVLFGYRNGSDIDKFVVRDGVGWQFEVDSQQSSTGWISEPNNLLDQWAAFSFVVDGQNVKLYNGSTDLFDNKEYTAESWRLKHFGKAFSGSNIVADISEIIAIDSLTDETESLAFATGPQATISSVGLSSGGLASINLSENSVSNGAITYKFVLVRQLSNNVWTIVQEVDSSSNTHTFDFSDLKTGTYKVHGVAINDGGISKPVQSNSIVYPDYWANPTEFFPSNVGEKLGSCPTFSYNGDGAIITDFIGGPSYRHMQPFFLTEDLAGPAGLPTACSLAVGHTPKRELNHPSGLGGLHFYYLNAPLTKENIVNKDLYITHDQAVASGLCDKWGTSGVNFAGQNPVAWNNIDGLDPTYNVGETEAFSVFPYSGNGEYELYGLAHNDDYGGLQAAQLTSLFKMGDNIADWDPVPLESGGSAIVINHREDSIFASGDHHTGYTRTSPDETIDGFYYTRSSWATFRSAAHVFNYPSGIHYLGNSYNGYGGEMLGLDDSYRIISYPAGSHVVYQDNIISIDTMGSNSVGTAIGIGDAYGLVWDWPSLELIGYKKIIDAKTDRGLENVRRIAPGAVKNIDGEYYTICHCYNDANEWAIGIFPLSYSDKGDYTPLIPYGFRSRDFLDFKSSDAAARIKTTRDSGSPADPTLDSEKGLVIRTDNTHYSACLFRDSSFVPNDIGAAKFTLKNINLVQDHASNISKASKGVIRIGFMEYSDSGTDILDTSTRDLATLWFQFNASNIVAHWYDGGGGGVTTNETIATEYDFRQDGMLDWYPNRGTDIGIYVDTINDKMVFYTAGVPGFVHNLGFGDKTKTYVPVFMFRAEVDATWRIEFMENVQFSKDSVQLTSNRRTRPNRRSIYGDFTNSIETKELLINAEDTFRAESRFKERKGGLVL